MDFGDRLRRLRQSQGLSVRELARRVGVSGSYISQLEQNDSKPSFSMLKKICDVMQTQASILTEDDYPDDWVVVRKDARRHLMLDNSPWHVEYVAFTGGRDKKMQPCVVRLKPGDAGPDPVFKHDREDLVFLLEGVLEVTAGKKAYRLEAGDTAYFNFVRPKVFRNPGPEDAVFFWVVSPAW